MTERNKAVLKSTGETVTILAHDSRAPGASPGGRDLCVLPPQSLGHSERKEWIGADKLRFPSDP
jgi:hypothetical protein